MNNLTSVSESLVIMLSTLRDDGDRKEMKLKPLVIRRVFNGFYCAEFKQEADTSSSIPSASKPNHQNKPSNDGQSQR